MYHHLRNTKELRSSLPITRIKNEWLSRGCDWRSRGVRFQNAEAASTPPCHKVLKSYPSGRRTGREIIGLITHWGYDSLGTTTIFSMIWTRPNFVASLKCQNRSVKIFGSRFGSRFGVRFTYQDRPKRPQIG